ncbi:hypothetical protein [Parapedobacter soli]|uniref:hypothetical protein n=1 Tax=Parapedobacter soli TaxID=416955 RepID=UPI0021CA43AA|nr:hypothetical protein [Parapedobacter soli]
MADELHSWNHGLITLGDFNIEKAGAPTYEAFVSRGLYVPPDLQGIPRTIFKKPIRSTTNSLGLKMNWL